jgi:hypothetical protein
MFLNVPECSWVRYRTECMAGTALFLPMLPTQILLNNILYDISEIPIPLDKVDAVDIHTPRVIDMGFVRNFMLVVAALIVLSLGRKETLSTLNP